MTDDEVRGEPFTDAENAFLRHVRFGELPARVAPDDLVASVETEGRRDLPEVLGDPVEWRYTTPRG